MPGEKTIGFVGGGNMAEAILKGLLAGGVSRGNLLVAEPLEQRRSFLASRYEIRCTADNAAVAAECDIVVLAVKPQCATQVLGELASSLDARHLIVSILAGVTTGAIEAALSAGCRVVRVMPNTPALVLQGAAAIASGSSATADDLSLVRRMFELVGKAWVVEEKLMDAVTGLSGSGPAYVFTMIEAMADAGVRCGLPRDAALGLAAQTVYGSAKLLLDTREHPAVLRERVTSPGGTTIAGMHVLERKGFRGAVMDAVESATKRSEELGRK